MQIILCNIYFNNYLINHKFQFFTEIYVLLLRFIIICQKLVICVFKNFQFIYLNGCCSSIKLIRLTVLKFLQLFVFELLVLIMNTIN